MTRFSLIVAFTVGTAVVADAGKPPKPPPPPPPPQLFHVTGLVVDHESRPVQGSDVQVTFSYDTCTAAGVCTPAPSEGIWSQLSGADGRFDITASLPGQPDPYAKNQKLIVESYGSETSVYRKRSIAWQSDPAFWTVDIVVKNAPAYVSPQGGYWARRIGCGEYPVFVVEGFDPGDNLKTGDRAEPRSWLGLLGASQLVGGGNLLDYLTTHNYSLYLLTSGSKSGTSIKSDSAGDLTRGMAYQAVFLAKTIHDRAHADKPMVIGGYSAGGLTARVGLNKWCDGTFAGLSGGVLDAGCAAVSLWFSGDAPQEGATVPISLQRYMHDDEIIGDVPAATIIKGMLDAAAAQEMLKQTIGSPIGDPVCNTNCAGWDMFGCESTDIDFMEECDVRTDTHDTFMAWVGGYPTRAGGGPVPAVAFSLGQAWEDANGIVPKPDYCWDSVAGRGKKYFENMVDCWGNHNLYVSTAGGVDECVPGSVLSVLKEFDGTNGMENACFGGWEIDVPFAPSYIRTDSALDWENRNTRWNDYWYEDDDRPHGGAIPATAGGFLLAWITEYTTGLMNAPLCPQAGGPPEKTLGRRLICRSSGGTGSESTLACPVAVEPLEALVATDAWGAETPGVGVLRASNFGAASPTYARNNEGMSGTALEVHGLELDPFDADIAYAYTSDGMYRNPRVWGVGTWTRILTKGQFEGAAGMTFPTGWVILDATPSATVQGRIHALVEGQNTTEPALENRYRFYAMVTNNAGASWTAQQVGRFVSTAVSQPTGGALSITPSPTDPSKVWLTSWAYNFNGCVWFTSCSTVWSSTDGGSTWVEKVGMRFPYTGTIHLLVPSAGNADNMKGYRFRGPAGASDPGLDASVDGLASVDRSLNPFTQVGESWVNFAHSGNSFFADPVISDRLVLLSKGIFLYTDDGGRHWIKKASPGISNGDIVERAGASWKMVAAASYAYIWNATLYTAITYSKDLGATWQKKEGNLNMMSGMDIVMSAVRIRP